MTDGAARPVEHMDVAVDSPIHDVLYAEGRTHVRRRVPGRGLRPRQCSEIVVADRAGRPPQHVHMAVGPAIHDVMRSESWKFVRLRIADRPWRVRICG